MLESLISADPVEKMGGFPRGLNQICVEELDEFLVLLLRPETREASVFLEDGDERPTLKFA